MQSRANLTVRFAAVVGLALLWGLVSWDWSKFLFLQSDTFWLLEGGRYILEHRALPAHDIYSFTRNGSDWVVYQWLFEVALAGLFQIGGWLFVSLFGTLSIAWLFCIDMPRAALAGRANAVIVVLVIWLALLASLPDVVALRPQIVTFVLLWLTQKVMNRNWPHPGRTLWLLVPIMVVWANVHISFVILLGVLGVYALVAAGAWVGKARMRAGGLEPAGGDDVSRAGRHEVWPFLAVLAACFVASLVNPYGVGIYDFITHSWQDQNITPELRPVDWVRNWQLLAYVVLAFLSIVLSVRHVGAPKLICAVMLLAAGLAGARFILYFVVWSLPIVCEALTRVGRPLLDRAGVIGRLRESLHMAILQPLYPLAVLLAVGCVTAARPTFFPSIIPVQAAEHIDKHRPPGPLFCGEHAGSYLIFRFHGEVPVFIDTRADVYGREFCETFRQTMLTGRRWSELADRFHIRTALVPRRYKLAEVLEASSGWRSVYKDETYAIFDHTDERMSL